jgi:hypothetical protein
LKKVLQKLKIGLFYAFGRVKMTQKHEYDHFCSFENNARQGAFPIEK